ncbi:PREDICTED: uncharacterized protein LOC105577818 [Cercocebus atys]|uniref:uncharacterized protein LOC105577818 n=1 Tax=Cercocebus atys TaxID=9531 RepID=UPI0005F5602F|nr:PREDICTED: uncharacterized protein LOC105577818 [Cercocebus atys]
MGHPLTTSPCPSSESHRSMSMAHPFTTSHCASSESHRSMSWPIPLQLHTVHPWKATEACHGPSLYNFTLSVLGKPPKHVMAHPFTTSHCPSSESHRSMSWPIPLQLHTVRPRKATEACHGPSLYNFTLSILGKSPKHVIGHPFTTSHCPSSESLRSMSWAIPLRLHTVCPRKVTEACHGPSIYDFTLSVLGKPPKHVMGHPLTTSHCLSSESHRSMSWPIPLQLHTVRPRKATEACHGPSLYDFTLCILGKSPKHVVAHPFTTSHCLCSENLRSMSWAIH